METENTSTQATETTTTEQLLARIAELEAAAQKPEAPAAAQVPIQRINRRVYAEHKLHGTCITLRARVYVAPKGVTFDKKSAVHCDFILDNGCVYDLAGNQWLEAGENPGCGARCPAALKATHGAAWKGYTHAERREIVKAYTLSLPKTA